VAFFVDDVAKFVGDLGIHPTKVTALEAFLTGLTQSVHKILDAGEVTTLAIGEALLHEATQSTVHIAVVQQVIGQSIEYRLGVEFETTLSAIPPAVGEPRRHRLTLSQVVCHGTAQAQACRNMVRMRVPRTFAFVDLSGFTNYTAVAGDDAAGRLLSAFRTMAREIASERGVRIAKWLGDGCMVVAVEQTDAIAFALELERRSATACSPLALRVGLATGLALLFEGDDYIGSAVNLAARLCDVAAPFEVLIPTAQLEPLPEGVRAEPHPPLELRGFPGAIDVVDLSGEPLLADRNDTGELWTRSPFVA
jgi:class 3 adenylate cyclase